MPKITHVRKITASAVVVAFAGFTLVGCTSAGPSNAACESPATSDALKDTVSVDGVVGDQPSIELNGTVYPTLDGTQYLAIEGEGTAITSDSQDIVYDMTMFDARTGAMLGSTSSNTEAQGTVRPADLHEIISGPLMCATEGSRIVTVVGEEDGATGADGSPGSIVAVIDVRKVYLAAASGSQVYNAQPNMPTVVHAPDGRPGIIVPRVEAPSEIVSELLIKGEGEEITADTQFRAKMVAVSWTTGQLQQSSWDSGQSAIIDMTQLNEDLSKVFKGATVGSEILLIQPDPNTPGEANILIIDITGVEALPTSAG